MKKIAQVLKKLKINTLKKKILVLTALALILIATTVLITDKTSLSGFAVDTPQVEDSLNQQNIITENNPSAPNNEIIPLVANNTPLQITQISQQNTTATNTTQLIRRRGGGGGGGGGGGSPAPPVEEPINQTNTTSPNNQTNQTQPTNQSQPTNQTNQTIPAPNNQTQPSNQTNQTIPAPNNQTNQTQPNNQTNQTQPNNQTNQTQPANQSNQTQPITKKGAIKKIKQGLRLRKNGRLINDTEIFTGINRFKLESTTLTIAEFDVNIDKDLDLSRVVAAVNQSNGTAFMHAPPGTFENITLYIPRLQGMNGVVICSNASRFDQVKVGCAQDPQITREYVLQIGDPNLSISSDGQYFLVRGITGTGGNGVNVTAGTPQRAPNDTAGNNSAFAGNITELTFAASATTQSWQGYFGNISGTIELTDNNNNVMYNWSIENPQGQIYASTNQTIIWNSIQCFNFTATGSRVGESASGGTTSLNGTNLSQIETMFNISHSDVDGVNETFSLIGAGTHDLFFTASNQFSEGECPNTRIFSQSGPVANQFEEVLLYEPITTSIVFTTILENNVIGFDANQHDFEMLVLENGHGTDLSATTYYFFAEIQ